MEFDNTIDGIFKTLKQCILTLDSSGIITLCFPENDHDFLGQCKGAHISSVLTTNSFIDDTSVNSALVDVISESGLEYKCVIRKIQGKKKNSKTLFITEADAVINLITKNERLMDQHKSLIQQRALELGGAQELLEKKARDLEKALQELASHSHALADELKLASELQKSLLPTSFPQDMPIQIAHRYIPQTKIGGDFFDFIRISEDKIGVIIIDVSGHGVAPAFITAMFKSTFNHYALLHSSPAALLSDVNKNFVRLIQTDHYLTGFYVIIDTKNQTCTYSSAGHPKQLLIKANGDVIELTAQGFFIGMFEGTDYEDESIDFLPGDTICCFTDGIMETVDDKGNQFGRGGIARIVNATNFKGLEVQADAVIRAVIDHMDGPEFQDDITLVMVQMIESL